MELHGLAASIQLPSDYANFSQLLALQPRPDAKGSAYGNGQLGGLEILLCAHQVGGMRLPCRASRLKMDG